MKPLFASPQVRMGQPLQHSSCPRLDRLRNLRRILPFREESKMRLAIMQVLIIDDEPLAHTALANILARRRDVERFDSANDAVEALDKLSKETYDVLLLDISMPEISGIELLDRLKRHDRPVPSVIFVTAHEEYALTAFEKHAVDYVLKPFSAERI